MNFSSKIITSHDNQTLLCLHHLMIQPWILFSAFNFAVLLKLIKRAIIWLVWKPSITKKHDKLSLLKIGVALLPNRNDFPTNFKMNALWEFNFVSRVQQTQSTMMWTCNKYKYDDEKKAEKKKLSWLFISEKGGVKIFIFFLLFSCLISKKHQLCRAGNIKTQTLKQEKKRELTKKI